MKKFIIFTFLNLFFLLPDYASSGAIHIFYNSKNQIVDVRDFGAKGDGVTNDWNAFQKAINALSPNQTLLIPKTKKYYKIINALGNGKDLISKRVNSISTKKQYFIVCNSSNVTIRIEGEIRPTSILGDLFVFNGESIKICGGGKIKGVGGKDNEGFLDTNDQDVNKKIQWRPSLIDIAGSNAVIDSISFEDAPTIGVNVRGKNCMIKNCTFIGGRTKHSVSGTVLFGIQLYYGSDNAIVKGCNFIKNSKGGANYSNILSVSRNNLIIQNRFKDYHEHGVYSYGDYCIIKNNQFLSEYVVSNADIQLFSNYNIVDSNESNGTAWFLGLSQNIGTKITNNKVKNVRGGIFVRDVRPELYVFPDSLLIENNIIQLHPTKSDFKSIIDFDIFSNKAVTIKNILIRNNKLIGNEAMSNSELSNGIRMTVINNGSRFENCQIIGNYIENAFQQPIYLDGLYNSLITNNTVINGCNNGQNFNSGIKMYRTKNIKVENNLFKDERVNRIMSYMVYEDDGCNNNQIRNNTAFNYKTNDVVRYISASSKKKNYNNRNYNNN